MRYIHCIYYVYNANALKKINFFAHSMTKHSFQQRTFSHNPPKQSMRTGHVKKRCGEECEVYDVVE